MSMIPWVVMAAASGVAGYFNPIPQVGEPGYSPEPRHHLRVMFENDSAFNHDGNYTHGTRIDYARTLDNGDAWGVGILQNIYTPEVHTHGAVPGQHPYAGYLALAGAYMLRGEQVGCSTELQLGTTGNASTARYMQNGLHAMMGMEQWEGWGDQVPSEMTFQAASRQDYRLPFLEVTTPGGWQTDSLLFTREEVGTVSLSAGLGWGFRVGRNLPPSMQVPGNSYASYGVGLLKKPGWHREELSWFVVGTVYTSYVARDMGIDGGVFHHFDRTCGRQPWQVEGHLGLGVSYQGIDYYAGALIHSRTYRSQDKNTVLGSFSMTWHW